MAVLPVWFWALGRAASGRGAARAGAIAAAILGLGATAAVFAAGSPRTEPTDVAAAVANVPAPATGSSPPAACTCRFASRRIAADSRALSPRFPRISPRIPAGSFPPCRGREESRAIARAVEELEPGQRLYLVIPPAYATPELSAALAAPGGRSRELARGRDVLVILRTRDPAAPRPPRSAP